MKVIDTRDGSTLHGACIAVIPAHKEPGPRQVQHIYGINADHRAYSIVSQPCGYDRMVLQLGTVVDRHFRVLQMHPHHKLAEDDRPNQDVLDAQLLEDLLGVAQ